MRRRRVPLEWIARKVVTEIRHSFYRHCAARILCSKLSCLFITEGYEGIMNKEIIQQTTALPTPSAAGLFFGPYFENVGSLLKIPAGVNFIAVV